MGKLKQLSTLVKYSFYVIILGIVFGLGIHYGRKTVKIPDVKPVVEYVEGKTIRDTIKLPGKPYKVTAPIDSLDIIRTCIAEGKFKDLWPKEKEIITKEDTTLALRDWATERSYRKTVFDSDTLGKFVFDATVQYNRLNSFGYEFTPVTKSVEQQTFVPKKWSPYIRVGSLFGPWNETPDKIGEIGGGLIYNDRFGAELKYQRGFISKNDYLGTSILIKF